MKVYNKEICFDDGLGLLAFATGCLIVIAIQSTVIWPVVKTMLGF